MRCICASGGCVDVYLRFGLIHFKQAVLCCFAVGAIAAAFPTITERRAEGHQHLLQVLRELHPETWWAPECCFDFTTPAQWPDQPSNRWANQAVIGPLLCCRNCGFPCRLYANFNHLGDPVGRGKGLVGYAPV